MSLAGLVGAVHGAFDPVAAVGDVVVLGGHDRYQAGAGIEDAAEHVAGRAEAAGLVDVEVLRFPADGTARWWTFTGPRSWTPLRAKVSVGGTDVVAYPEQAYSLGAYSAAREPTVLPVVRWAAGAAPDPRGALVVLEELPLPGAVGALVAGGAAGVVTDPLAGRVDRWPGQVGRIELPAGVPLFAFSATAERLAVLRATSTAFVEVVLDTAPATMPVVTGRRPGDPGRELLLSAHLCHPRPSANDNASGVAALLGLAAAFRELGVGPGVRFVWGPEFTGMAAYLHDVAHAGRAPLPTAAVNIDMAGQDQRRCGGPLVLERVPDELPAAVGAVAQRCATLLPAATRSYSGAVPCEPWAWRTTPYVGASDHAMLAGPPTRCPTVGLGHWPDRANHTSADTVDLVDPDELRRTATIAGATVAALADPDRRMADDVAATTLAWAAAHVTDALPTRRKPLPHNTSHRGSESGTGGAGDGRGGIDRRGGGHHGGRPDPGGEGGEVFDAWAGGAGRRVRHRAEVAVGTVRGLAVAPDGAVEWIRAVADGAVGMAGAVGGGPELGGEVLAARWAGPFNLRRLGELAGAADREWLAGLAVRDRGGSYARLLALARGIDGRRDRTAIAWWASAASELPVPADLARRFLDVLEDVGWAGRPSTVDSPGGHRC